MHQQDKIKKSKPINLYLLRHNCMQYDEYEKGKETTADLR